MPYSMHTMTLVARELEAVTDRLDLLLLWTKADDVPEHLRHLPRDLEAARDSIDTTLMDVRDAIADEAGALDRSIVRHPAGRDLAAGDPSDDVVAFGDELDVSARGHDGVPESDISDLADLAVSALTADPDRTRAVLRDIADAGTVSAPLDESSIGRADTSTPTDAEPVDPAEADLDTAGPAPEPDAVDAGDDETSSPPATGTTGGRHRKPETDEVDS